MDTPEQASSALDTNQAASLIADFLEPPADETKPEDADPPAKASQEPEDKPDEAPEQSEESSDSDETITIEVDGKMVEIKKSELPDLYKGQLRQADYTKKTMEVAEQRKAAEAQYQQAVLERQQYAQGLVQTQALLQAQLQEQAQIDWQKLLETDPVEYLKQQHLAQARQAQLQRVSAEHQQLNARQQAEEAQMTQARLQTEAQQLIAKLPEWKDASKAQAEREAIKSYLKENGFDESSINSISDHRAVLLARKAMLYDKTVSSAQAAAKKVSNLPTKMQTPGGGETKATDGRTQAMRRFSQTGSIDDAARVFAQLL